MNYRMKYSKKCFHDFHIFYDIEREKCEIYFAYFISKVINHLSPH